MCFLTRLYWLVNYLKSSSQQFCLAPHKSWSCFYSLCENGYVSREYKRNQIILHLITKPPGSQWKYPTPLCLPGLWSTWKASSTVRRAYLPANSAQQESIVKLKVSLEDAQPSFHPAFHLLPNTWFGSSRHSLNIANSKYGEAKRQPPFSFLLSRKKTETKTKKNRG